MRNSAKRLVLQPMWRPRRVQAKKGRGSYQRQAFKKQGYK